MSYGGWIGPTLTFQAQKHQLNLGIIKEFTLALFVLLLHVIGHWCSIAYVYFDLYYSPRQSMRQHQIGDLLLRSRLTSKSSWDYEDTVHT